MARHHTRSPSPINSLSDSPHKRRKHSHHSHSTSTTSTSASSSRHHSSSHRSTKDHRERERKPTDSRDHHRNNSHRDRDTNRDRERGKEKDRERDRDNRDRRDRKASSSHRLENAVSHTPSSASSPRPSATDSNQNGEAENATEEKEEKENGGASSTPAATADADSLSSKPTAVTNNVPSPASTSHEQATPEVDKVRLRREKLEQWKRKKAEEDQKAKPDASNGNEGESPATLEGTNDSPEVTEKNSSFTTTSIKRGATGPFGIFKTRAGLQSKAKGKHFSKVEDEDAEDSASKLKKLQMMQDQPEPVPALMEVDVPGPTSAVGKAVEMEQEDEDVDPLDAFMVDVTAEVKELDEADLQRMKVDSAQAMDISTNEAVEEEDTATKPGDPEDEVGDTPEEILALAAKRLAAKKKDFAEVDHTKMEYEFFRRDFYIEPPELREMTPEAIDILRAELGIKIRGVNCPKPIQKWTHCGLPAGCPEVIKKLGFTAPTPIQSQAISAIMNGRDVIGVAKTGSGKTIAFLLPMFRHIKDQRPLEAMEGPVAIVMTPTRELAVQIHRECKNFLKALGLRAVCAYGGSAIKDQIADLKRGAEIIICTPGRLIDLLCANSGRVTNLRRVTYLVLDEADRMFDMGFEPQVMKIVKNVRPQRQTVLFSATFPRQMEALARKVLRRPLEITVGGRSVVCEDVKQIVEVREDSTKFVRLLEILGNYFMEEKEGKVLIFVDRQEAADNLLRDLIRRSYLCMSLHGGKDQLDRESTISDFKAGVTQIVIATSVAARGLDVKGLNIVINYECPNHLEDYVHRVGRTGRAGQKGIAYTFITPEQDRYAVEIAKALKISGQEPPEELAQLVEGFREKVKSGAIKFYGSGGFGGKGLEKLDKERDLVKQVQKKTYGGDGEEGSDEEDTSAEMEAKVKDAAAQIKEKAEIVAEAETTAAAAKPAVGSAASAALEKAQAAAAAIHIKADNPAAAKAQSLIAELNAKIASAAGAAGVPGAKGLAKDAKAVPGSSPFSYEFEINDYPQRARWKATNKENISQVIESTGAAITTRGQFFEAGKPVPAGERKLYLIIEGEEEEIVDRARAEIKRILTEATVSALEQEAKSGGRYSVV